MPNKMFQKYKNISLTVETIIFTQTTTIIISNNTTVKITNILQNTVQVQIREIIITIIIERTIIIRS